MSRVHISNNLGKVGNLISRYQTRQRMCRNSQIKASRSRSRSKDEYGYVLKNKAVLKRKK